MAEDRREFLKAGFATIAGLTALPIANATEPGQKVPLTKPVTVQLLENKDSIDGDREETRAKFDLLGSNGARHRITGYSLKIEREDSYDTTVVLQTDKFRYANDAEPVDSDVRVVIVHGDKGTLQENHRNDEIQITAFGPEGSYKSPLQSVKKAMVDPYADLTPEKKAQAILDNRLRSNR